jgi:hypothetical protein
MDAGEQVVGGGIERGTGDQRRGPERAVQLRHPVAGDHGQHPRGRLTGFETLVAGAHLLVHVRHVEMRDAARTGEHVDRVVGRIGVHVHLEGRAVADDQDRVARAPRARDPVRILQRAPVTTKLVQ